MRATPRPYLARAAAITVTLLTTLAGLVGLPAVYLAAGLPIDGRIAGISVVAGIVAGLLVRRRFEARALAPETR